MTWARDLLLDIAEYLDAEGVGTWQAAGAYPDTPAAPPVYQWLLPDTPDEALALSEYGVDDTAHEHSVAGLQVRCRGTTDPTTVQDLSDAIYAALHRPRGVDLARTGRCPRVLRQSHVPIGRDQVERWEIADNYYLLLGRAVGADPVS